MARLIDADDVINKINAYCKGSQDVDFIRKLVENQPTAYDVEKVVEELEQTERILLENASGFGCTIGIINSMKKALDIVRKGGVNDLQRM